MQQDGDTAGLVFVVAYITVLILEATGNSSLGVALN